MFNIKAQMKKRKEKKKGGGKANRVNSRGNCLGINKFEVLGEKNKDLKFQ